MTLQTLLAILPALFASMGVTARLPENHPLMTRAESCAQDVLTVVKSRVQPERQDVWARVLFTFAELEGGCLASPVGFNDAGRACGVLQVHNPEKVIEGATCEKVRKSRKLGLEVGLVLMMQLTDQCGSIGEGLTAYAMYGACPSQGYVLPLVKRRCKMAGGCS